LNKLVFSIDGPEFISSGFELWCKSHEIELMYIQPDKPTQNCLIERLNGAYRKEMLDVYMFFELNDVKELTENWIEEYNERCLHESLNNLTPSEWAIMGGKRDEKGHAPFHLFYTLK